MQKNSAEQQDTADLFYMRSALELAQEAAAVDEVPVGALIVKDNEVISATYNLKEKNVCATGHAEILAIEEASKKLGAWRLTDCTLYVSLEPCVMCTGALISSRITRVVFAAFDPKGGALGSVLDLSHHPKLNHKIEVRSGLLQKESAHLLKTFFASKRNCK